MSKIDYTGDSAVSENVSIRFGRKSMKNQLFRYISVLQRYCILWNK